MNRDTRTEVRVWFHTVMTAVWGLMIPIAIVTRWLWAIAFVSACSIYANAAAHWGAREAALADKHSPDT